MTIKTYIAKLVEERATYTDKQILSELSDLPVLPDEYMGELEKVPNPAWQTETTRQHAYLFVALADLVAQRKLRQGVPLLLERASYGDFGEMMRDLRHSLEATFNPDWDALAKVCLEIAKYPHRGARLWAIAELGILKQSDTLQTLLDALYDSAELVRIEACHAVEALYQKYPEYQTHILIDLETYIKLQSSTLDLIQKTLSNLRQH
jgi:hypothetical protein